MRSSRARRAPERGAAAVEFGLVALILFTLIFGIIQFSFWFWSWQAAGHAAREAARVGAVDPCDSAAVQAAGAKALEGVPTATGATVTATKAAGAGVGDEITVTVTFESIDMGFFPFFDPFIDKSATSRIENVPAGGCGS